MLHILAQHDVEMAWPGDQEVVKAFPSHGSDEAFRDRVRPGCPDRGADDPDIGAGEHSVERGGALAVPVTDQEPEPVGAIAEVDDQVACLLTQAPVGWAVIPAR